ncbi:NAD-dependent epimerase/dehydratase family protein [Sphingobacterium paucimobilis]|uniref:NAD-dependent epimerase/dehydratase domain-containing protein n=1 Tax=Sphingobacterium paucimobilis HER1398 TaxID=1346330 RepID=U2HR19_9SPHI|nr:NAD-dependent epimerase/dehydratase family protein [Sphingobacterium paucimobilis]ERJ57730.1 hypothetical protein M472_03020 [Sphingobacterium paucimobilis HER1398]
MNVCVSGVSGFVGKYLSQFLKDNSIDIQSLSLRDEGWKLESNSSIVALIHLAGKAHDTSNTSQPEEYFKVNRDLTIELFNQFINSSIRDFFFFSSVKAVADTVDGVLGEEILASPQTPYGQSKWEAEKYLQEQVLPAGKRLFIIRPCMIHGPDNKGNLNLLYQVVRKGLPWPLASFHNQRSFLSIDNLCYLIAEMIRKVDLPSGVYNCADDETLSTNELVALIATILGKMPRLWHIPEGVIKASVKIGDFLPLPLNSERLKKLTESYVVSNAKIKAALGIEKLPLTAKAGLEKTIRSFNEDKK